MVGKLRMSSSSSFWNHTFMTSFARPKPHNTKTGLNRVPACTVCKNDLVLQLPLDLKRIDQLDQVDNILGIQDMQKIGTSTSA